MKKYEIMKVNRQVASNHKAWADFIISSHCRIECELLRLHYLSECESTHEIIVDVLDVLDAPTDSITPETAALIRAQALYAGVEEGLIRAPRELHNRPPAFVWPLPSECRDQGPDYYAQMLNAAPAELVGIRSRWDWAPGQFAAHGSQIKVQGRRHDWRVIDDRLEIDYLC